MPVDESTSILILMLNRRIQRLSSNQNLKGTRPEAYLEKMQRQAKILQDLWADSSYHSHYYAVLLHDLRTPLASVKMLHYLVIRTRPLDLEDSLKGPLEELHLYIEILQNKFAYLADSYHYTQTTANESAWEAIIDFEGLALIDLLIDKIVSLRLQKTWKSKDWHLMQIHQYLLDLNHCWQTMEDPNYQQRSLINSLIHLIANSLSLAEFNVNHELKASLAPLRKISDILREKLLLLQLRGEIV
jgi:signal transduction histidine kinase